MTSFLEMIRLGATSADNDIRKQNEERLISYRQRDPNNFLKDCMCTFTDKNTEPALKQAIGTIVKISFASENVVPIHQVQGKDVKSEIKTIFIDNLISKNEVIKLVSADAISTIFVLDYNTNDWPDLLENLAKNTRHASVDVKKSAIITLGYICEKLVKTDDSESIATGIAEGLLENQNNQEIKLTALKALQDSLPLFHRRFQEDTFRDNMLALVIQACNNQNEEIIHKALQCLGDMFKSCYPNLTNRHMEVIADRTLSLLQSNRVSIIIAITDFWNRVAKYEEKLDKLYKVRGNINNQHFTRNFSKVLVKELLPILVRKDDEDIEAGLSLHGATLDCLVQINTLAQEEIKDLNVEFIDKMMSSDDQNKKVAALMCFEALILGHQAFVRDLIASSFTMVLNLLKVDRKLCKAALKVLRAAALKFPEVMLKDGFCVEWLELLVNLGNTEKQFSKLVCELIRDVAEGVCTSGLTDGYFVSKADYICEVLIENSFKLQAVEQVHIINESLTTVVAIVKGMRQHGKLLHMVNFLSQALSNLQLAPGHSRGLLKEGILVCCLAAIYMLKKAGIQRSQLKEEDIGAIYQFCNKECSTKDSSFSDALTVMIGIASSSQSLMKSCGQRLRPKN